MNEKKRKIRTPETDGELRFENELYYAVRTGNTDKVRALMEDRDNDPLLFPLRFRRSLFCCAFRATELLTAMRFACFAGGCPPEMIRSSTADFIERMEECRNLMQLSVLLKQGITELASLCLSVRKYSADSYSPLVNRCIGRILERMPARVSLSELAKDLHVTPRYLSTLFNRDTGMSITDFCQEVRISEARYLLSSSDMDYPDISHYLCYGSQSYFNQVFKKRVGMTPREYRAGKRNG